MLHPLPCATLPLLPAQDAKLPTSLPQGAMHVVVLGAGDGAKGPLQLTMRPSALAAEGSAPPPPRLTAADLAPGKIVPGWVSETISFSPSPSPRALALEPEP